MKCPYCGCEYGSIVPEGKHVFMGSVIGDFMERLDFEDRICYYVVNDKHRYLVYVHWKL